MAKTCAKGKISTILSYIERKFIKLVFRLCLARFIRLKGCSKQILKIRVVELVLQCILSKIHTVFQSLVENKCYQWWIEEFDSFKQMWRIFGCLKEYHLQNQCLIPSHWKWKFPESFFLESVIPPDFWLFSSSNDGFVDLNCHIQPTTEGHHSFSNEVGKILAFSYISCIGSNTRRCNSVATRE